MNTSKLIIIYIISFCLFSCKQKFDIDKHEITKIEVHYIPFDIMFPVSNATNEESIRGVKSYQIDDTLKIDNIVNQIKGLLQVKSGRKFNKDYIYLICDFYTKEGKAFTLMYDQRIVDIDGKLYENNDYLIRMLIKKSNQ